MEEPSIIQGNAIISILLLGNVYEYPYDLYPNGGVEVVLGVQWLQSLGQWLLIFRSFS